MWLSHDLTSEPPTCRPDIAHRVARVDATDAPTDPRGVGLARPKAKTGPARLIWPGTVSGLVGLSVGGLVSLLVPGSAYTVVTVVVAILTAVIIGWHFDRMVAALHRLADHSQG